MKTKIFFLSLLLFLFFTGESLNAQKTRTEQDLLGKIDVPADAYYGAQAARAMDNFKISGQYTNDYPEFLKAWGMIKLACARANTDAGKMKPKMLKMIEPACKEVIDGKFQEHFKIDLYQGGAGTSTNMCANEIIANRALELAGHKKGDYDFISPNDEINMSQSTNDTYPTSLKLTMLMQNDNLKEQLKQLIASFNKLGGKYIDVLKMGRTEMQDAVPMTVGQEFYTYASMLQWELDNLNHAEKALMVLNMGGTAIGTGLNTPEGYDEYIIKHLREITGYDLSNADDMIAATSSLHGFVVYSSALKTLATTLSKISNDLIILSSGPRNGIFKVNLPPRQPGSSIMPGKVNPVIPELMALISYRVMGNDVTVNIAASDGHFELNVFKPMMIYNFLQSARLIGDACVSFNDKLAVGIEPNIERIDRFVHNSLMLVTALNTHIGYEKAAKIAKKAYKENNYIKAVKYY